MCGVQNDPPGLGGQQLLGEASDLDGTWGPKSTCLDVLESTEMELVGPAEDSKQWLAVYTVFVWCNFKWSVVTPHLTN